jgi:hypothetical protein
MVAALAGLLPLGLALWARPGRRAAPTAGALAAIAGGGLWAQAWIANSDAALEYGWALIGAAVLLALAAAGLLALPTKHRLSQVGLWLATLGALVIAASVLAMAWYEFWPAWGGLLLGLVAHGAGLALFGGVLLRQRTWGRFGLVPLLVGLVGSIGPLPVGGLLPEGSQAPVWLLALGLGGGWVLLGAFVLWQQRHAGTPLPLRTAPG